MMGYTLFVTLPLSRYRQPLVEGCPCPLLHCPQSPQQPQKLRLGADLCVILVPNGSHHSSPPPSEAGDMSSIVFGNFHLDW